MSSYPTQENRHYIISIGIKAVHFHLRCFNFGLLQKGVISTTCPLVLDETNYACGKVRMTTFIKSFNSKSWKPIIIGTHPMTNIVDGKASPKAKV